MLNARSSHDIAIELGAARERHERNPNDTVAQIRCLELDVEFQRALVREKEQELRNTRASEVSRHGALRREANEATVALEKAERLLKSASRPPKRKRARRDTSAPMLELISQARDEGAPIEGGRTDA